MCAEARKRGCLGAQASSGLVIRNQEERKVLTFLTAGMGECAGRSYYSESPGSVMSRLGACRVRWSWANLTGVQAGPSAPSAAVAELQGLYGAFTFPEKLLQKIWLRGDFQRAAAVTADGRRVRIVHPGKWNLLGGPDFSAARLRFDEGPEVTGDVELHLHAGDWEAHGHARDPAYDRVMLHVVLFPPEKRPTTTGAGGREIPVLALLPLLHRALEEFAADEAVELLANRAVARLPDELGTLPAADLGALLRRQAAARWRQKVRYAQLRVERLGWEGACHHTALEILGYRFNRAPMLRIAGQHALAAWAEGAVKPDEVFVAELEGWSLQGVRPANHPRTRLRQYACWTRERPDWPARVKAAADTLLRPLAAAGGDDAESTRDVRRRHGFGDLRERLATEVCAGTVGGTRLDNVICDGLLPLLAANGRPNLEPLWFHWFAGDLPPLLTSGLRQLGFFDGRTQPACHGAAQGLLGWLLEREARS